MKFINDLINKSALGDVPVYGTAFREYDLAGAVRVDKGRGHAKLGAKGQYPRGLPFTQYSLE